jgi:hypothetical protein
MNGTETGTVRRPWDQVEYTLGQIAKYNIPIEQICRAVSYLLGIGGLTGQSSRSFRTSLMPGGQSSAKLKSRGNCTAPHVILGFVGGNAVF